HVVCRGTWVAPVGRAAPRRRLRRDRGARALQLLSGAFSNATRSISGNAPGSADQKTPPFRDRYSRLRAAYTRRSGSSAATATARPGGRPRPDSRHVEPVSCETRSGGFASTTATTVDP